MASWGMGVAQGLKLYDDEVRRREELDRYLSERELFDAQLSEQLKAQESMTAEKDIARDNSKIINEYQNALAAGDKSAAAEALNRIYGGTGIRFSATTEGLQRVDGSGNIEEIKLSSEEVLPYVASAGQSRTESYADYKAGVSDNAKREQEWRLAVFKEASEDARTSMRERGANSRAQIAADASRTKGVSPFIEDYKGDAFRKQAKEYASSLLFGQQVQYDKDTGEYFIIGSDDTNTPVRAPLSKTQLAQLEDMTDRLFSKGFTTAAGLNFNTPSSSALQHAANTLKENINYAQANSNVAGGEVTQGISGNTNTIKPIYGLGTPKISGGLVSVTAPGIPPVGNPGGVPRASGTVGGAVDRIFRPVLTGRGVSPTALSNLPEDSSIGLLY